MNKDEALKLALEWMGAIVNSNWRNWEELASPEEFERWVKSRANHCAEALRLALAQPEQEPVAWRCEVNGAHTLFSSIKPPDDAYDEGTLTPLYAAPPSKPERTLELKVNGDGAICGMGVKVDWPTFHLIDCGWNATEVRNLTRAVSPDLLTEWVSYCAESRDPQVWMVAQGVATPLLDGDGVWMFMVNRVGRDIANADR